MLNTERRKSLSGVDAHIEMAASNKCITTSLHDKNDVPYRLIADRTTWLTSRQIKSRKLWQWPIVKHLCARNRARTRLTVQNSAIGSYDICGQTIWTSAFEMQSIKDNYLYSSLNTILFKYLFTARIDRETQMYNSNVHIIKEII